MESTRNFWRKFVRGSHDSSKNSTGMMTRWMSKSGPTKGASASIPQKDLVPEEALERVLAYLPLPSLFRARCVCKKWRSIIASPRFLKVRASIASMAARVYFPMVVSTGYGRQCCAFDFVLNSWQSLAPIDFVPYKVTYVAGARGLLCLRNCFELLVICNPITRRWKSLPRSASHLALAQCMIHMLLDSDTQAYKIVVVSGSGTTEVFDSVSKKWVVTSKNLPPGVTCIRGCTAAFCNGFLYCVVDEGVGSKLSGVIAYDVQLAVWSAILIALPTGFGEARSSNSLQPGSLSASLVECRGHVMLVAEKLQLGVTLIHIFELHLMSITWLEVAFMPFENPTPFESFKQGLRTDGVVVHGHRICLISQIGDMALLDLSEGSWHRVPDCPFAIGKNSDVDIAAFPFVPSLDAHV